MGEGSKEYAARELLNCLTGKEAFKENGTVFDLTPYFKTYVAGKEVPADQLKYKLTYYDSEGNALSGAPSAAGTYKVLAELIPAGDKQYGTDWYGTTVWELGADKTSDTITTGNREIQSRLSQRRKFR